MIEYSWRIDEMLRAAENGHEQVVTLIRWTLLARDPETGREEFLRGALTPPMPEAGAAFTPWNDLTKPQIEGWLEAQPGLPDWRQELASRLTALPPAAEAAPLPWLANETLEGEAP